ncbi:MAG TPA: twin-arginine translocation signal domain-containing protein [Candidatus Angelobacter sp.]
MPVSRRKFLQNGAVAAATLAAAPLSAWSSGPSTPTLSHPGSKTLMLSRQAFEQAVGSAFKVSTGAANSQPVWVTLLAVNDLPAVAPINAGIMAVPPPRSSTSVTTTGFMLLFQSSAPPLGQGSYTFEHAKLGQFPLFIVPGGTQTYVAVFNLLSGITNTAPSTFHPSRGPQPEGTTGGGSISSPANPSGSTGGRPAQETLEPVLRDHLEPKLPE